MNLFKKTTASVALVSLVSGVFSTGVAAMDLAEINAATSLANKGFINKVETVADFKLDTTITRAEQAKVTAMIAGVSANDTCEGKFSDVTATTPNDWVCGYVEALLAEGLISANEKYNPNANVSKSEAVKFALSASGEEVTFGADWQADFVAYAAAKGYVASFTDYNTAATRGFVFSVADAAHEANAEGDILGDLIDQITDGEETTEEPTDSTDTPVVSENDELMVTLSPTTPEAATVPGAISGLPVAKFDFTAGSEDVKISSLTVKRTGLSTKDTITSIAVFTEEGRASKGKNDSQENDTQALINLDNGGVVVKAGETKTLTLVADIASSDIANGHEFALSIMDIVAEGTNLELASNLKSKTITIGGVDAPQIVVSTDGSVSDPKIGEEAAEIFKFKIEGASDEDVTLKSITLKASENDVDEDFENYELVNDGEVISTLAYSNGKYVTFNLNEGFVIDEDKTEKFIVKADVVTGAGDEIEFYIDKNLDVRAEGSKFNYGASANISAIAETGNEDAKIEIQAGKLTLSDMDAPSDKIRADKKNTVLGTIKVRNVAGTNLELQKFAVQVTKTGGDNNQALKDILENVEARINGSAYELTAPNTDTSATGTSVSVDYADSDLNVSLPQGDVEIIIEADIKEDVAANTELKLDIIGTNGTPYFTVKETEDDKTVSDITPSSLSFKKVTVITSGAKVAAIPLADTDAVRGAKDISIAQFEVEAEEASLVTVDEVQFKLTSSTGAAFSKQVSRIALYKGSISDSNLLDDESSIPTSGIVTFNSFRDGKVSIAAKAKQTFVIAIDLVDGVDVENATLSGAIVSVSAEDDDSDDVKVVVNGSTDEVTLTNSVAGGKDLTVKASGKVEITADAGNDANKDVKTILAGESATVFSADVSALNEGADVEEVTFSFSGADLSNFKKTVTSASLYLDGVLVKTNSNSDIVAVGSTGGTVKFTNLTDFIVPQSNVEVAVKLNTANIGFEKVGKTLLNAKVVAVAFTKVDGESSGKAIELGSGLTNLTANAGAKEFSVVPAVVTPSVATSLNNSSSAEIKILANAGNNRETNSNSVPNTNVKTLSFDLAGTSYATGTTLTLINTDDAGEKILATIADDYTVTFELTDTTNGTVDRTISNGGSETFRITIPAENDKTLSLRLIKTGVTYTVGTSTDEIKTNLTKDIDFGSRKY